MIKNKIKNKKVGKVERRDIERLSIILFFFSINSENQHQQKNTNSCHIETE